MAARLAGVQRCIEVEDIHAAWAWVVEHGGTPVEPPAKQPWNAWSAFILDPAGLRVMLYAPIAGE